MASLQIIISSIQDILSKVSQADPKVDIDRATWGILGAVVATKLILFLLCRGYRDQSPSIDALSQVCNRASVNLWTVCWARLCWQRG